MQQPIDSTIQPAAVLTPATPPAPPPTPVQLAASTPLHTITPTNTASVTNILPATPTLPPPTTQAYNNALSYINTIDSANRRPPPLRVERVNQLDAHALDGELHLILSSTYKRIFKYFDWFDIFNSYQHELNALLTYAIYRYTVLRDLPTPANKLQNLVLRSEQPHPDVTVPSNDISISRQLQLYPLSYKQKRLYIIFNVIIPYIWHRLRDYMTMSAYGAHAVGSLQRRLYNTYGYFDTLYNTLSLCNMVTFLYNSRYSTLADRLLSLRYVYVRSRVNRQISFDFMNQQLAWQTMIEFVMYVYPFITSTINAINLRRYLTTLSLVSTGHPSSDLSYTTDATCPICSAQPCNIPYQASCGCVYCYYCVASHKLATSRMVCNRCTRVITDYQPYKPQPRIDAFD